jgi:hypothetical protein
VQVILNEFCSRFVTAVPFILPTVRRSSVGSFVERDFLLEFYFKFISILHRVNKGTYKVRNEIETKRNETKSTKTKRNETKSTKTKRNETKSTK